jgi:hypothetical protein
VRSLSLASRTLVTQLNQWILTFLSKSKETKRRSLLTNSSWLASQWTK